MSSALKMCTEYIRDQLAFRIWKSQRKFSNSIFKYLNNLLDLAWWNSMKNFLTFVNLGTDGAQSWHCCWSNDHQLCKGKCYWLHQTLHEPWHLYPVQDSQWETHKIVQLHESSCSGNMALCSSCLCPCIFHTLCYGQVRENSIFLMKKLISKLQAWNEYQVI